MNNPIKLKSELSDAGQYAADAAVAAYRAARVDVKIARAIADAALAKLAVAQAAHTNAVDAYGKATAPTAALAAVAKTEADYDAAVAAKEEAFEAAAAAIGVEE